jgi:hypothetical protein
MKTTKRSMAVLIFGLVLAAGTAFADARDQAGTGRTASVPSAILRAPPQTTSEMTPSMVVTCRSVGTVPQSGSTTGSSTR